MFDINDTFDEVATTPWEVWYQLMVAYKEEHGHCLIPRRYVTPDGLSLWYWVVKLRENKVEGLVPDDQIEQMDALEFVWEPHDDTWEKGFIELQAYKRTYGDCLVPYEYETKKKYMTGLWVRQQCYFDGNYPMDKSRRLRKLGFIRDLHAFPAEDHTPIPLDKQ